MMLIKKQTIREIVFSPGFIILALLLLLGISFQALLLENLGDIREIISAYGLLGPLFFIFLIALGIILAPINGFLIWLPGFYIFGLEKVTIYSFTGGLIGASTAFFIARKFGRPVVMKLVGKKEMVRVDKLTEELGIKALWILRLFGGTLFDAISYAAGLTNIKLKDFLIITFFGPIPMTLLVYLLIKDTQDIIIITTRLGVVSLIGLPLGFGLLFLFRKKKTDANRTVV